MYRLNVIGCGKVGRVLARLLVERGGVSCLCLVSRSEESAHSARDFIGSGVPKGRIADLPPADLWMITAGDVRLEAIAEEIAREGALSPGDLAFHCSGAVSSSVLAPLRAKGAVLGSAHPIRSFADPALAYRSFPGTACALEGEPAALERLSPIFRSIGAETFELSEDSKTRCHAGHVMVSNNLVALLDLGRRLYESAGVPKSNIDKFMSSLVQGTLDNVKALGTTEALTGPIVRGEVETVLRQLENLRGEPAIDKAYAAYALLGLISVEISERRGAISANEADRLKELLGSGEVPSR